VCRASTRRETALPPLTAGSLEAQAGEAERSDGTAGVGLHAPAAAGRPREGGKAPLGERSFKAVAAPPYPEPLPLPRTLERPFSSLN